MSFLRSDNGNFPIITPKKTIPISWKTIPISWKTVPISWKSKKLDRVTKSPLALEALALSEAADAGFLISSLVHDVFGLSSLPVIQCNTDNASLYETLWSTKVISDKRLKVDVARL